MKKKWLPAVTDLEARNSIFNPTDQNNSFSLATAGHWSSRRGADTINELKNAFETRHQNDSKVHVEEFRKSATQIKIS